MTAPSNTLTICRANTVTICRGLGAALLVFALLAGCSQGNASSEIQEVAPNAQSLAAEEDAAVHAEESQR